MCYEAALMKCHNLKRALDKREYLVILKDNLC